MLTLLRLLQKAVDREPGSAAHPTDVRKRFRGLRGQTLGMNCARGHIAGASTSFAEIV